MKYRANAQVETPKAERYMKALCNHFSHKVTAEYTDQRGNVQFGFGSCEMNADANTLVVRIEADDVENFGRVKQVIADHLERFSGDEALKLEWSDDVATRELNS